MGDLLKKHQMDGCKLAATPMASKITVLEYQVLDTLILHMY
jgi:hypothetical protein